jgi:6-phosphogluconate dehydrogenase (decarboxylating)
MGCISTALRFDAAGGSGGATAAGSIAEKALGDTPRAVWVILPAGEIVEKAVEHLGGLLEPDNIVIDSGNSFYKDDMRVDVTAVTQSSKRRGGKVPAPPSS